MDAFERFAFRIAADDLRYSSGSALSASTTGAVHPKLWPFLQWGVMVAFEANKHLADVHQVDLELQWEKDIAEAARHSGKFF